MIKYYFILSIILFSMGIVGVISRRNILVIYMSIELMLNAINLSLVAVASFTQNDTAEIIAMMIIAIAAAEAALFMALFVLLFKHKRSLDVNLFNQLKANKNG